MYHSGTHLKNTHTHTHKISRSDRRMWFSSAELVRTLLFCFVFCLFMIQLTTECAGEIFHASFWDQGRHFWMLNVRTTGSRKDKRKILRVLRDNARVCTVHTVLYMNVHTLCLQASGETHRLLRTERCPGGHAAAKIYGRLNIHSSTSEWWRHTQTHTHTHTHTNAHTYQQRTVEVVKRGLATPVLSSCQRGDLFWSVCEHRLRNEYIQGFLKNWSFNSIVFNI